jgi:hypothetical protein
MAIGHERGLFEKRHASDWIFQLGVHTPVAGMPDRVLSLENKHLLRSMTAAYWDANRSSRLSGLGTVTETGELVPPPALLTAELFIKVRNHLQLRASSGDGLEASAKPHFAEGFDPAEVLITKDETEGDGTNEEEVPTPPGRDNRQGEYLSITGPATVQGNAPKKRTRTQTGS